jgi:hypothetical protein
VEIIYDELAAGHYLGGTRKPISRRSLQRWRQAGRGPKFLRLGGAVRYRERDLDQWLADCVAQSTADLVGKPPRRRPRAINAESWLPTPMRTGSEDDATPAHRSTSEAEAGR